MAIQSWEKWWNSINLIFVVVLEWLGLHPNYVFTFLLRWFYESNRWNMEWTECFEIFLFSRHENSLETSSSALGPRGPNRHAACVIVQVLFCVLAQLDKDAVAKDAQVGPTGYGVSQGERHHGFFSDGSSEDSADMLVYNLENWWNLVFSIYW